MVNWESFYNAFRAPGFIPGYEIQHRLGGGAFGEVYKARKLSIGKPYAIKFLKLDDQADREAVERELEQVRLFASIDHPNLVTIEDMGLVHDVPYLIMGYAGEETLARRLRRGALDRDSALRTFVQVCRGVLALHDRRLAHFDLKPGNVFLKGDVARVGDYGLAKLLVEGRSSLSFGRGTPHYMAPEMLKNRADQRADLYSLGVILYECLVGCVPYGADQPGVIVREEDAPPAFPVGFPAELRATIETCLRLSPDDRFDSVHELLEDLGQTARQGDSVRLAWSAQEGTPRGPAALGAHEESAAAGGERVERADAGGRNALVEALERERRRAGAAPEPDAFSGGDLRRAAGHLARGAFGVAVGVWDGVTGRGTDVATPRPAQDPPPPRVRALSGLADDVVSVSALGDPDDLEPADLAVAIRPAPRPPGPVTHVASAGAAALAVPVPPREEGGVLGAMTASVVLGAEILGALLTGPVTALLRGLRSLVDAVVRGLPGVLGAAVRLVLFLLLCLGLGAAVGLLFVWALLGWSPYL